MNFLSLEILSTQICDEPREDLLGHDPTERKAWP